MYCEYCGCQCVVCFQIQDACDDCELKYPELLDYWEV